MAAFMPWHTYTFAVRDSCRRRGLGHKPHIAATVRSRQSDIAAETDKENIPQYFNIEDAR